MQRVHLNHHIHVQREVNEENSHFKDKNLKNLVRTIKIASVLARPPPP